MSAALVITVLHELPGRLRVGLSQPLRDLEAFERALRSHEGIEPLSRSPASRSVLMRFDPGLIRREELLLRAALAFSLEHDGLSVRIEAEPPGQPLTNSVAASGALLLAAGLARLLGLKPVRQKALDRLAGLATGASVLAHAAQELKAQGSFHPEVVSVAYLAIGLLQGQAWRAGLLTWFAAFGRHILERRVEAIEVRLDLGARTPVVSAGIAPESGWRAWLQIVPGLFRAFEGPDRPGGHLLANLHEVSALHDRILDALGPWKKGIPLRLPRRAGRSRPLNAMER